MTGVNLTLEVTDFFSSCKIYVHSDGDNDECSIQLRVDDKFFEEKVFFF
jgi:hypothetical protein